MRLSVLLVAGIVAGCAAPPAPPAAASLAGTSWQLHAIQSMDDAQGTTRIADPRRFTLLLSADGRATLRLDCNRGTGTWEAAPAGNDAGTLRFGPIATTRAQCTPPHLDERVVRDLAFVRGYRLHDGALFMSLLADGASYEWRPGQE
jgi:heat shock protein HslJ